MAGLQLTKLRSYDDQTKGNDFALIRLVEDVKFSKTMMPVCLPWPYLPGHVSARVATVAGWGSQKWLVGPSPNTPHEVDVDTMTNAACSSSPFTQPHKITGSMLCAASPGKDSCSG